MSAFKSKNHHPKKNKIKEMMKKYHNQVDMPILSKMKVILKECKDKAKKIVMLTVLSQRLLVMYDNRGNPFVTRANLQENEENKS